MTDCLHCTSANTCTECIEERYLKNDTPPYCVSSPNCPSGFFSDDTVTPLACSGNKI